MEQKQFEWPEYQDGNPHFTRSEWKNIRNANLMMRENRPLVETLVERHFTSCGLDPEADLWQLRDELVETMVWMSQSFSPEDFPRVFSNYFGGEWGDEECPD